MSEKKTDKNKLTARQKRFIDAYNGNATEAARIAGYSENKIDNAAYKLMHTPAIMEAILEREKARSDAAIMTREERQKLWSDLARNADETTRDRLRATELLGKSEGDFLDRQELTGKDGKPLSLEPVQFKISFVDCVRDEDGMIDKDKRPHDYAAFWLKKFFIEGTEAGTIKQSWAEFCNHVVQLGGNIQQTAFGELTLDDLERSATA